MMIKVSVIIPVYNDEKYVVQCVKSVLDQTLKEIEIVCVDDGSTDASAELIKSMMQMEERIVLQQQSNKGPGIARNSGIRRARGKYVVFLDADDYYLDNDALEKMYNACEEYNIAVCACLKWCINDRLAKTEKLEDLDEHRLTEQIFSYKDYQMDYNFINYMFLKEFLNEKQLWFPPYYRFEDPPFLVKTLYEAKEFIVVDACLYYYRSPVVETRFDLKGTTELLQGLIDNLTFARRHYLSVLYETTLWRIEYEYANIILKKMIPYDTEILKLLIQINYIVNSENGKEDYIIRPLRNLQLNQCEKNLLKKINEQNKIALYGAGELGRAVYAVLKKNNLSSRISHFLVTNMEGNKEYVEEIPVIELERNAWEENIYIFVTAGRKFQKEMEACLKQRGYRNYEVIDDALLCLLAEELER